jgi:acyl-CoA thioesterase-1
MKWYRKHRKLVMTVAIVITLLATIPVSNILIIRINGTAVPVPEIPRNATTIGSGPAISFMILGDSTAVGQGGDYARGIAVSAAELIAKSRTVTYQNFAVSGARVNDVLQKQLPQTTELKPDIVLISVGANDVTHLTKLSTVRSDTVKIVEELKSKNPAVKIILTGSPQMGSVLRFPQPTKYLAKLRTEKINNVFEDIVREKELIFAPVAKETGAAFAQNPSLFAADKFHPNTAGYDTWVPVINDAVKRAL